MPPMQMRPIAFIGGTIIDGLGGKPVHAGVVLTNGDRIEAVGRATTVPVPDDAEIVDITGRFVLPGLMDGNVHLVPWPSWTYIEFLARYEDRLHEVALEAAQIALRHGFTTVFDSMGPLDSLTRVRESISSGEEQGARIYVAGNIAGFRAVFTTTAAMASASAAFQKRINDRFEAGAGPELSWKSPEQIYEQMSRYAASGVDFVKYGATGDGAPVNSEIGQDAVLRFSPDQQRAIIDAVHDAGLTVQTHTTSAESLHIAVELGNDMGQHAAHTGASRMYERTLTRMLEIGYSCGTQWAPLTESERRAIADRRFPSADQVGWETVSFALENAVRLIEAGVPQLVTTDAGTIDPDVALDERQWGGLGGGASLIGEAEFLNMRGMVDRGMTPMSVVQAATINIARAYHVDRHLGSLEAGKMADLVILDQDPLADVEHLRSISTVVKGGRMVDRGALPLRPVLTSHVDAAGPTREENS
jgi:imidazolonepropionase-like amidohydrolase